MSNLRDHLVTASYGIASTVSGAFALANLLDAANAKAVALQIQLTNAPEVPQQVYGIAKETVKRLYSVDLYSGLVFATVASLTGGIAIYRAFRKKE